MVSPEDLPPGATHRLRPSATIDALVRVIKALRKSDSRIGWPGRIRTSITGSKGPCPAIGRPASSDLSYDIMTEEFTARQIVFVYYGVGLETTFS